MKALTAEQAASLPLGEFRELVQAPARATNDIGGVLFGDWASPIITREFVRWGVSPTFATIGMFVAGVAGAAMLPFGGVWSLLGALAFVGFYVLDCVDGEVARQRGVDRFFWSYPDFFFGAIAMALFYLSLGVYAFLFTGIAWMIAIGGAAAVILLLKKFADVCHVFLTVAHVLEAPTEQRARYAEELAAVAPPDDGRAPATNRADVLRRYGRGLGLARAVIMNFHLSMLIFTMLCALDLVLDPRRLAGSPVDLKSSFLVVYTGLMAIHLLDHLAFLWRAGFLARSAALVHRLAKSGETVSQRR